MYLIISIVLLVNITVSPKEDVSEHQGIVVLVSIGIATPEDVKELESTVALDTNGITHKTDVLERHTKKLVAPVTITLQGKTDVYLTTSLRRRKIFLVSQVISGLVTTALV